MNRESDKYRDFSPDVRPARREEPRYDRAAYQKNKKKHAAVQIIRAVIQLAAFILIPELFITVFSAIGSVYTAIIGGSFVLSEQLVNILIAAATLILTAMWGRFFCGWLCSFGAMQDLFRRIGRTISKKNLVPEKADRILKYLKYAVLLFIVIGVWTLGVGANTVWSPWTVFGAYASPLKGFPTELIFLSIGGGLLLLTVVGSMFIDRFFCRYLCPLGALFAMTSRFRFFKIRKPSASCGNCRRCAGKCPMAIPLNRYDEVSSGECVDCMKCASACYRENVTVQTLPAVSGTVAAVALAGITFVGTLPVNSDNDRPAAVTVAAPAASGVYKDGTYIGTAAGYRGDIGVSVTVENGNISDITVESSDDDRKFLQKAENGVIPAIISEQSTEVATVSGATYSSRGIINAVEDAIGARQIIPTEAATSAPATVRADADTHEEAVPATEAAETDVPATVEEDTEAVEESAYTDEFQNGAFADGVYTGYGSGFRGTTAVSVTVEGGRITDITVLSYEDDDRFFNNAQYSVIADILSSQSIDVAAVSGATFSSNSIIEAVADALGQEFQNPNSTMSGGHGHH